MYGPVGCAAPEVTSPLPYVWYGRGLSERSNQLDPETPRIRHWTYLWASSRVGFSTPVLMVKSEARPALGVGGESGPRMALVMP